MSHAVQEPNFTQQFVLHRYWQQCQCVPRTKLREYEVTREVVRANEQLIMSMRWVSARVFIITAIKLLSSDRSLTIVGASITSTILLRDLGFLAYHLYASTHNTLFNASTIGFLTLRVASASFTFVTQILDSSEKESVLKRNGILTQPTNGILNFNIRSTCPSWSCKVMRS